MAGANFIALTLCVAYSIAVQQLELLSVRLGTPQGYTAFQSQLLHTATADSLCKECHQPLNKKKAKQGRLFCGYQCYWKWMKGKTSGENNPSWKGMTVEKECLCCRQKFNSYVGFNRKYCSIKCSGNHRRVICKDHPWRRGQMLSCATCGKQFYAQNRDVTLGKKKYCSVKCNAGTIKKGQFAKEKHPMWRGDARKDDVRARESEEYKQWRIAVMIRDGFTCQECGKRGGRLSAHHIKKFVKHKEVRNYVPNGITLCWPCHSKINGHEEEHEARFTVKVKTLL